MSPPPPLPSLLPTLAPRIPGQTPPEPDAPTSTDHTEAEWEAKRPLIIQLYLNENKKLVQLMAILESRHGFAATSVTSMMDKDGDYRADKSQTTNVQEAASKMECSKTSLPQDRQRICGFIPSNSGTELTNNTRRTYST